MMSKHVESPPDLVEECKNISFLAKWRPVAKKKSQSTASHAYEFSEQMWDMYEQGYKKYIMQRELS